jgi:hypothetical protein
MSVLGDRIRDYAEGRRGTTVGRGECADLATAALRSAGARASYPSADGHYVWGQQLPAAFAEPGDILQFRNFRAVIRNDDGTGFIETRGHPHHTAVVIENPGNGTLRVAEQNMRYGGAAQADRTVSVVSVFIANQTTTDRRTVTVQGGIWAFRPQPAAQPSAVLPRPHRARR